MAFYVSLEGVTKEQLEFLGYQVALENDEFAIYCLIHTGEEQIVRKSDPRLYVEDLNDAVALGSRQVWRTPDMED